MDIQFCAECGSALDEKGQCPNASCSNHRAPQSESSPNRRDSIFSPSKTMTFKEKGKKIVPDCIEPDLDEIHIKQYDIARLQTLIKGARAEGRLQVTNKRLVFRSTGFSIVGPTSLQHEFSIEEIAGIEIRKEARLNAFSTILLVLLLSVVYSIFHPIFLAVYNNVFIGTVFSTLLAAAAVFLFFLFHKQHFLRYAIMCVILSALPIGPMMGGHKIQVWSVAVSALVFFISMLYIVFAPNLVVRILTKGGNSSVDIRKKDSIFSFQHNEYTGFSQVMPGPDTDLAIKELGALIREVQQTGTYSCAAKE